MGQAGVSFKGIHRETNDAVCKDGECMQLFNATATKEGVKMMPGIINEGGMSAAAEHVFFHAPSDTYIYIAGSEPRKAYYTGDLTEEGTELEGTSGATGVSFVGNIACISTDSGIDYQLWKDGGWNNLGNSLPCPTVRVNGMELKVYSERDTVPHHEQAVEHNGMCSETIAGLWSKVTSLANKDRYFYDRALFRVAIRLFDGSIVNISPAVCVEPPRILHQKTQHYVGHDSEMTVYLSQISATEDNDRPTDTSSYCSTRDTASSCGRTDSEGASPYSDVAAGIDAFKPDLSIDCDSLDTWKDFISSIELYSTGSIGTVYIGTKRYESFAEHPHLVRCSDKEYKRNVENSIFRLIKTYDADLNETWSLEDYSPEKLQTSDALDDSLLQSIFVPSLSYTYNGRLHIADYIESLKINFNPVDNSGMMGLVERSGFSYIKWSGDNEYYYRVKSLDVVGNPWNVYYQAWAALREPEEEEGETPSDRYAIVYTRQSISWSTSQLIIDIPDSAPSVGDTVYTGVGSWDGSSNPQASGTVAEFAEIREEDRGVPSSEDAINGRRAALFKQGTVTVSFNTSEGTKTASVPVAYMPDVSRASNSFISYKDMRVANISFYRRIHGADYGCDSVSYTTQPFGLYNMAYHVSVADTYYKEKNDGRRNPPSDDSSIHVGNVVKVSEIDNPFVFPSSQAYTIGSGTITGMMSNTTALSEGQHGRNPLYVFTDEGVKALVVDATGKLVYSGVDEVSRDVLTNARAMCGTDNAVVFATSRGIMMASGRKTVCLSDALDGDDSFLIDGILQKLFGAAAVYGYGRSDNFRTYISGDDLRIGYDYDNGHVYVSNPGPVSGRYRYCYVYDIGSGEWSKRSATIVGFVDTYPIFRAITENAAGRQYLVRLDNTSTSNAESLLLMSRPMKLGVLGRKKLNRFALTAKVRQTGGTGTPDFEDYKIGTQRVGVYVLGSNDGFGWQICSYKETARPFNLLAGKWCRGNSYRYFVVVVKGSLRTNSIIDGITMDADATFSSSLAF